MRLPSPSARGAALWALGALGALGLAGPAEGQPDPRRVTVTLVGPGVADGDLPAILREGLRQADVTVVVERAEALDLADVLEPRPPADGGPVDPRAWAVRTGEAEVSLLFADRHGDRVLLRRVPLADGWDPVVEEAVGQILVVSLGALVDGIPIGPEPGTADGPDGAEAQPADAGAPPAGNVAAPAEPPEAGVADAAAGGGRGAEVDAGAPPTRGRWYGDLALAYRVAFSARTALHGPRLEARASTGARELRVAGGWILPARASNPDVGAGLELEGPGFALGVGVLVLRADAVRLVAGADVELDVLQATPLLGERPDLEPQDSSWNLLPALGATLTFRLLLRAPLSLDIAAGLDVDIRDLRGTAFVVPRLGAPSTPEVVYRAWPVRPRVAVGLRFDVAGRPP
ncbi:MAG: hypothetical protein ACFCGT_28500 [Sandaracinaceae bacterium]